MNYAKLLCNHYSIFIKKLQYNFIKIPLRFNTEGINMSYIVARVPY